MRLFIIANNSAGGQLSKVRECVNALEKSGHSCSMSLGLSKDLYGDETHATYPVAESDIIVSLGGDGAVLKAAKLALATDRPLLGINAGRVGYLCTMDYSQITDFDVIYAKKKPYVCSILETEYDGRTYQAINDVIIGKTNFGQTVDLSVEVDDKEVMKVRGDGVIITTPTGSTAYNRNAGGPIIDEEAEVLGITPICADTAPLIVAQNKKIRIRINHDDAGVYVDGEFLGRINDEEIIRISDKTLLLYK